MSSSRSLSASFWLMVAIQTIGSVDLPGAGARKLPSPRQYVAIVVAWLVLFLVDDAGGGKAAAAIGWVTVLAGVVAGPFGGRLAGFFRAVGSAFGNQPAPSSSSATGSSGGLVSA